MHGCNEASSVDYFLGALEGAMCAFPFPVACYGGGVAVFSARHVQQGKTPGVALPVVTHGDPMDCVILGYSHSLLPCQSK